MRAAVGALIVAALAAALAAQQANPPQPQPSQQPPQPPPQPTFRTEANYVRVDVYPTKDDAPVSDLRAEDFDVSEDGRLQKIEQFEHIVIRGNLPEATRIEPNTVRESRAMLENSRARVFVLFLDPGHVDVAGSHNIRGPLVETLNRMIGPDDLVGVMTPEMSALDVTFVRRTATIEGFLTKYWNWGERDRLNPVDPVEQKYEICYGPQRLSPITAEMIARRREKLALDAIQDLVRFLRGVREERKAILAVTDGWLLYRPSSALMSPPPGSPPPTPPPITVDPRSGTLTTKDPTSLSTMHSECDRDRMMLAQIDDQREFLQILDEANRANASFYPIDPRGMAVFDTPIEAGVTLVADAGMLRARSESLRTLAGATDGTAIITNDISGALRRVIDDLSSYYLLGYYSSGRLDGKFHSISVRVKRPGIRVRARRGYLAANTAEADAAAAARANAVAAPSAEEAAETRAIDAAVGPLDGFTRDLPIRLQSAAGWKPDRSAAIWIVGELGSTEEWRSGAEADVQLVGAAGGTLASTHVTVPSGTRTFRAALKATDPLAPGDYSVRVRARGAASGMASSEVTRFSLPAAPDAAGVIFIRRGPTTGNREVPTADLRFRRNEQLRVEIPAPEGTATARLLDRKGKPLAIPVTAAVREDADGARWQTAQLALAPLAAGDYVIELSAGVDTATQKRVLSAFRVVQ